MLKNIHNQTQTQTKPRPSPSPSPSSNQDQDGVRFTGTYRRDFTMF